MTHDLAEAAFFARRLVLLRAGARSSSRARSKTLLRTPAEPFVTHFVEAQRRLTVTRNGRVSVKRASASALLVVRGARRRARRAPPGAAAPRGIEGLRRVGDPGRGRRTAGGRRRERPVEDRRALGGTRLCWDALVGGALDLYPEYTGTLRQEILRGDEHPRRARRRVRATLAALRATLAARGLGFIGPLGFDNRYALAMREEMAARLGIRDASPICRPPPRAAHRPQQRVLAQARRLAGPGGALCAPGRAGPGARSRAGDPRPRHRRARRDRHLFDGRRDRRDGLRVLADDRGFFPRYQAILLYRRDAEARWPAAFAALAPPVRADRRRHDDAPQRAREAGQGPRADRRRGLRRRAVRRSRGGPHRARRGGRRSGVGRASTWRWSPCRWLAAILCALPLGDPGGAPAAAGAGRAGRWSGSSRRSRRWRCWCS